ncbi:condensation domain-containing protein [Agrobacterium salinitolerans]|uniref:Agrobactine synthetase subunit F n=1 Tax=Agrobacterium salinitolerans TaxID=1183413 RepID=A0ABY3BNC6_9HYPH|nr:MULTISPECIES: condensation domain-containing protein [Agrobacterium]MCZ7853934.1 condensation domain-containing protein [Agrobacterium salinitolerans]MCZ7891699.1 condensation domain-containing protein [Agrobacterium salinitolerans]MCZ7975419.1 condensation domain-containing protein [Agrobacterium salinitolerans]TRA89578.1 agrobactine synthetase subunit F [Agrobacterium salinitolerans]
MAADNTRMLARRIEESFDRGDAAPPSQYEERVWFEQFQDPDQVFRALLAYRIGEECDLLRLTSALKTVCEVWPELRARFAFGEDGTLAKSIEAPSASIVQLLHVPSAGEALTLLHDLQARPFDAETDPPFQAVVLLSEGEILLAFLVHGLLGEVLSPQILLEGISAAYAGEAPKPLSPRAVESDSVDPLPLHWLQRPASGSTVVALRQNGIDRPVSHSHGVDLPATLLGLNSSTATNALLARAGSRFALFLAKTGGPETVTLRLQPGVGTSMPMSAEAAARVAVSRDQTPERAEKAVLSGLEQRNDNEGGTATFTLHALATPVQATSEHGIQFEHLPLPSLQSGLGLTLAAGPTAAGDIRLELTGGRETSPHATAFLLERFVSHLEGGADFSGIVPQNAAATPQQATLSPAASGENDDDTVATILAEFREALVSPEMGPDDDFFDFGGHSLIATRIIGRLLSNHGIELRFNDLFSYPTAASLARQATRLETAAPAQAQATASGSLTAPLSLAQMSLWKAYAAFGFGEIFNIPFALDFLDPVDENAFECAFLDIIERHPGLRTHFYVEEDTVLQKIVPMHDLPGYKWFWTSEESQGVDRHAEAGWRFDLARELPMRLRFLRDAQTGRQVLSFLFHHIVLDEWSVNLMMDELTEAYRARAAGKAPVFATRPAPFHEFARKQVASGVNAGHLAYWTDMLRDAPKGLTLKEQGGTPHAASQDEAPAGGWIEFKLEKHVSDGLYAIAKQNSASLFNVVYAAIAASLRHLGGLSDLVVGTSASGRTDSGYFDTIGYFTTVVAHRVRFGETMTVGDLISSVKNTINGSLEHSEIPIDLVEEALGMTPGRDHLFEVFIQIHAKNKLNGTLAGPDGKPVEFRQIDPDKHESMLGLQFEVMEETIGGERSIRVLMSYRSDRYGPDDVERLRHTTSRIFGRFAENGASNRVLTTLA